MFWNECFILMSVILLVSLLAAAVSGYLNKRYSYHIKPFNIVMSGLFMSIFFGLFPVNFSSGNIVSEIRAVLTSLLCTIQVFALNADTEAISETIITGCSEYQEQYSLIMSFLFLAAPLMTFGFIISLLVNVSSYPKYFFCLKKKIYVFSELSIKSAQMAQDLKKNNKNSLIVFTDTEKKENDAADDISDQLRKEGAVFFRKTILEMNFRKTIFSSRKHITFFEMSESDADNINQSIILIEKYRNRTKTRLYVLLQDNGSGIALTNIDTGLMKVRQIDHIRSLVYRTVDGFGNRLFRKAVLLEKGSETMPLPDERVPVNTLVVGMGRYGREMVKALSWYGQMDGFRIYINAVDSDPKAESRFRFQCPELMDDKHNGVFDPEDSEHFIRICSGIETDTYEYEQMIKQLRHVSYIFVSLGKDEKNIRAAVSLRMIFERMGEHPVIQAVVYQPDLSEAVSAAGTFMGESYDIEYIGDIRTSYSENVIINSDLEKAAFERHKKRTDRAEEDFWKYEYYYRTSSAAAVHMKARIACGIPGADMDEHNISPEEKQRIAVLEHRRWNTYMRSEGYVFSGSEEESSRNDLGRMHHCLIRYSDLSESEKDKDIKISLV